MFIILSPSRPSLRPELQRGQRSVPGPAVEGSGLHRRGSSHWIPGGHGQEGLIRLCYSDPGGCEPPLPAGRRPTVQPELLLDFTESLNLSLGRTTMFM